MAVRSGKKGVINQSLIISSGIAFLAASLLIYLFILRGVFGKFKTADLIPNEQTVKNIIYGPPVPVAILYSRYTQNMMPDTSTWEKDNINTWEKFLFNSKYRFDIIADSTIELGLIYNYKIIILPGSKSLSDKEIMQLKKYVKRGGSIFATSGIASYSDDGKWRGWDFFSEVFGLKFSTEISNDQFTQIHTLRGGLPITANIPAGYPLKVATWDRPIAAEVLDPRTIQASFWYNYRLQDGLVRDEIKKSAGIAYGTYGRGRFVWMGFDITSVIGVQEDYIYFDRLFNNSMNWLFRNPVAFIKDWPSHYSAAAVLVPTITKEAANIDNLLPILSSENVKATFFIEPQIAEENKNIVKNLTSFGDIGSLVDIGHLNSVNDTVNKLYDYASQYVKLSEAKKNLEAITNSTVTGCMPYYGLYDQNTIKALINSGYKYVFTDSLTDRSVPKTMIRGDSLIVGFTKTARDDYEIIRDFKLTNQDFQFYTYQEDIDRILFEGGLYLFKLHTEYQCRKDNVEVVKRIIEDLKKKNYWITTASEIEKWWARKNYVEVRVSQMGETRTALIVSNPGTHMVTGLVVQIDMSKPVSNIKMSTEIIGTKLAKYGYNKLKKVIYVYINKLEPEESRTYYLDYDIPDV